MKNILSLLSLSLCIGLLVNVTAQDKISDEKRKIIKEIAKVTKADVNGKKTFEKMLDMMSGMYPGTINSLLRTDESFSEKEKQAFESQLVKSHQDFTIKFRKRLFNRINIGKYIEQSMYPLYANIFTADELRDLLKFYKTPTGKKLTSSASAMTAESIRYTQEHLMPMILEILNEIVKEDIDKLKKDKTAQKEKSVTKE